MSVQSRSALLALTLGAAPLLISTTAQAAESTCGQPAQPAVHDTVHHPAEDVVLGQVKVVDAPAQPAVPATFTKESYVVSPAVDAVPAVTSPESQWTLGNGTAPDGDGWALTGNTRSHDAVTQTVSTWTKVTEKTEYEWVLKVVTQPATTTVVPHPAVYETQTVPATYKDVVVPATYKTVVDVPEHTQQQLVKDAWVETVVQPDGYAYVDKHGHVKYGTADWNNGALDADSGWSRSPGDDLTTTTEHPAEYTTVTIPATYKQVVDVPEHTESVVDVPEHTIQVLVKDAWEETVPVPEQSHYDRQWTTSATDAPGDGWVRSDAQPRVTSTTDTVQTQGDAPGPEGYALVSEETTTVTPGFTEYEWARTVVVTPARPAIPAVMGERDVMLTPEVPATEEVSHLEDLVVTFPGSDETVLVKAAVPAGPACAAKVSDPADPAPAVKPSRAASAVPATLAFTGFDPALYAAGGMVLILAGSGLTLAARRRRD